MSRIHVRIRAGGEHYALPVEGVREIGKRDQITAVPGSPASVLGVWNLRGDVIAAVDLAAMLGLRGGGEEGRMVVTEDGDLRAGLVVDSVIDVCSLPEAVEAADSEYLDGSVLVDRTPVGIVDLGALLGAAAAGVAP